MKTAMRGLIYILYVVCAAMFVAAHAQAGISMPEREQVQTIVWIVELVSFIVGLAIVWFIWRLGKRQSEIRKSQQDKS